MRREENAFLDVPGENGSREHAPGFAGGLRGTVSHAQR